MKDKRHFKSIRASMILMILVLVTSCIVAGTYAKYVSSNEVENIARVAKFGVTIEGGGNVFSQSYNSNGQARVSSISVLSTDDKNVVAPGTEGTMTAITVSGTPEVSVRVEFEGNLSVENWEVVIDKEGTKKFYCPIIITVEGQGVDGTKKIDGTEHTDADSFAKAVNDAIASFSQDYSVEDFKDIDFKVNIPYISWEWLFDRENEEYDNYDTQLGNKADATIALIVTTTVTQLD